VFSLYRCSTEKKTYSEKFFSSLRTLPQVVIVKADINLREILHLYVFISLYLNCESVKIFCQMWAPSSFIKAAFLCCVEFVVG
jgi:hypothetical protein